MKAFIRILVAALLFVAITTKSPKRRLVSDPATPAAAHQTLDGVANEKYNGNTLYDKVSTFFRGGAPNGAMVLNLESENVNFCIKNDVMQCMAKQRDCSGGSMCHLIKINLPLSSGNMKVIANGNAGVAKEGHFYTYSHANGLVDQGTSAGWTRVVARRVRRLRMSKN